jgi:hypothetical protein
MLVEETRKGAATSMNAVFVHADRDKLLARRRRALKAVGLSVEQLRDRVERGVATPEEREAWHEVDSMDFLLADLES